jgi:cytochrome c biogenesis protein CcmG, thiol:disulfide interchange protein DsbE
MVKRRSLALGAATLCVVAGVAAWYFLGNATGPSGAGDSAGPPITGAMAQFTPQTPPRPAPVAEFLDADGNSVSLLDFGGKVVLLNIWATWCEPCKVEMPSIEALHKAYGPRGLKVVAVSIDDYVTEDSIRSFAKGLGLTFDILHDPSHTIDRSYQTTGWPETFVIAKDGVIRKKWIGPADWNSRINRVLIAELLGFSDEAMAPTPGAGGDTAAPVMLQRPSGEPQRLR